MNGALVPLVTIVICSVAIFSQGVGVIKEAIKILISNKRSKNSSKEDISDIELKTRASIVHVPIGIGSFTSVRVPYRSCVD